jgi:hypothetical protein
MSASQRNVDATLVAITPSLSATLRHATLSVLERHHHAFDEVHDRTPDMLLFAAEIHRDAIAVLDTIGWLPAPDGEPKTIQVPITDAHLAQLRELRTDLGVTVLDYLDIRADIDTSEEIAEVDEYINNYRTEANDLLNLIRACH